MTWQFTIAGFAVGVLVGLTGMGGGSLMTPTLILIFGFDPKVAVGTDILNGAIFKSFGAWRHRTLGTVHARLAGWMLIGSVPMSLIGVELASQLGSGVSDNMARIVGAALIVGGIGFALKTFLRGKPASDAPFLLARRDRLTAIAIGASCGFVVGLTSVGSGTFFGLAMLLLYPLTAQKIVGTDVFQAAALLWVAGVSHFVHGNVDTHALAWLLIGSIPGVLIGSNLSIRVPERSLRLAFAVILVLSGIKIVEVPHADAIVVTGSALAATAAILLVARWFVGRPRPAPLAEPAD